MGPHSVELYTLWDAIAGMNVTGAELLKEVGEDDIEGGEPKARLLFAARPLWPYLRLTV